MKNKFLIAALSVAFFTACNSGNKKSNESHDMSNDTTQTQPPVNDTEEKALATPPGVNAKVAASVKKIVDGYLSMKNALTKDNDKDAAAAGKEMVNAFTDFDKVSLTASQAEMYNDIEDDAREHAEHIGENTGNLKHQREHFDMLSKDVYELVKSFGGGQPLYKDYCPMYNDKKGAIWLSETKEIKNPYYGSQMLTCGSVKEEIK
ncbi:hypothetical protein C3K47_11860 [Solitalea longa]|uniref:DUF3347 domain-containing protein n=1 Tax=Solitalea longa TaxID=2079460 RepID=A0A2S5A1Q1_9SPHI|nr:DUF3347 domain-containing protein [Solitalea longa]POY36475.1 hypothetical protein C3K47_11860 [Solitalea longa]